ncbi:MAG: hypothetical protein RL268_185 [Pseudomonadota bacterium]|jgi:hypothetical protein
MTAAARLEPLLDEADAAEMLGLSVKTLQGLRRRGEIAYIRLSSRMIRYQRKNLEDYLERSVTVDSPLPRELPGLPTIPRRPSVYFVRSGKHGPIKIGFANTVRSRLHALRTAHHEELILLATMAGGAVQEQRMHEKFAHLRLRGEWFSPDEDLLCFIESLNEWAGQ